ncbi:hypothetical protein BJ982_001956 [Sphaerisporangium siamense]|uniref:Uncharacterized protein n=1 Tax=Sphaerisporangium siamense TaxID=795645 RepID=A0A7W7D510_9ACTN|nr:hypothetical protein [Sphaerisporangium siamense]
MLHGVALPAFPGLFRPYTRVPGGVSRAFVCSRTFPFGRRSLSRTPEPLPFAASGTSPAPRGTSLKAPRRRDAGRSIPAPTTAACQPVPATTADLSRKRERRGTPQNGPHLRLGQCFPRALTRASSRAAYCGRTGWAPLQAPGSADLHPAEAALKRSSYPGEEHGDVRGHVPGDGRGCAAAAAVTGSRWTLARRRSAPKTPQGRTELLLPVGKSCRQFRPGITRPARYSIPQCPVFRAIES